MNKALIALVILALSWFFPSPMSTWNNSFNNQQSVGYSAPITDEYSDDLIGKGDEVKKFINGVVCGAGGVAIIAGFLGGAFTGGASAVITAVTLVGTTAQACGEAFS